LQSDDYNSDMFILTSSDNKYVQHLGVMLVSLLENCKKYKPQEIAVINDGISGENIEKLNSSISKFKVPLRFIKFDNKAFSHLSPKNNKTLAAFHRIFIDEFYPPDAEKVLYLDCDIIVRKDIAALYKTDISQHIIGAVQNDGLFYQEILGMPAGKLFFNSGVLLVNLKKWREFKIQEKLVDYISCNFDKMLRNDQDALNGVLYNDWLPLNPVWNTHLYFFTSPHLCSYDPVQLKKIITDPAVVHFTTRDKPWYYSNRHLFKKDYYRYLKLTAWKDYVPPDKSLPGIANKFLITVSDILKRNYKHLRRSVKKLIIIKQ
jgi:lipopolysaccharide biosynthesis glycosyltransferase